MNSKEFDFDDLAQCELEIAVDQIIEQHGLENVMRELDLRAFQENMRFFQDKLNVVVVDDGWNPDCKNILSDTRELDK